MTIAQSAQFRAIPPDSEQRMLFDPAPDEISLAAEYAALSAASATVERAIHRLATKRDRLRTRMRAVAPQHKPSRNGLP